MVTLVDVSNGMRPDTADPEETVNEHSTPDGRPVIAKLPSLPTAEERLLALQSTFSCAPGSPVSRPRNSAALATDADSVASTIKAVRMNHFPGIG